MKQIIVAESKLQQELRNLPPYRIVTLVGERKHGRAQCACCGHVRDSRTMYRDRDGEDHFCFECSNGD